MYCTKLGRVINEKFYQCDCKACWNAGQWKVWRKRMIEEYGHKPGKRQFLLRRDCRMNYLTNEPPTVGLTKSDINEAD